MRDRLKDAFLCSWLNEDVIRSVVDAIESNSQYSCLYPNSRYHVFKAFSLFDDNPKLVIMGQNPYPDECATGVAFEISHENFRKNNKNRKSLAILAKSLGVNTEEAWFDIAKWAKENRILLCNAALSYPGKNGPSQYGIWRPFWGKVLPMLNQLGIVAIALGYKANKVLECYWDKENLFYRYHPCAHRNNTEKILNPQFWEMIIDKSHCDLPSN